MILLYILLYLTLSFGASCAYYAGFQGAHTVDTSPSESKRYSDLFRRSDSSDALFFGMVPVIGWILCPLLTGFFEYGFAVPFTVPKRFKEKDGI